MYSHQITRISRSSLTESWLARTWAYPFAPSNLVTNLGMHILNAVAYPFGVACYRLRCFLLASVQYTSHIFCITGVCQFPCYHNCETRIFFSQNMPKTPVTSQTSVLCPTQKLLNQFPDVCTSTDSETINSRPIRLSFNRHIYQ